MVDAFVAAARHPHPRPLFRTKEGEPAAACAESDTTLRGMRRRRAAVDLTTPPARPAGVSTIDPADIDERSPRERLQQEEAPAPRHWQERPTDVSLDAPSNRSEVRVRLFAFAFVALLCAMVVGFASEIRPLRLDSPDHGYDEALGTQTSSQSNANFLSNCSDAAPATAARRSNDGLDKLGVGAIAAHAAASATANFMPTE